MPNQRQVTIVGAGFSGLASAYYLARSGCRVRLIDRAPRSGGLINTLHLPEGMVETAANGFLNSVLLEELFLDLQIEMIRPLKAARRRYIVRMGRDGLRRARRWPLGLSGTIRFIGFLVRAICLPQSVRPEPTESVRAWAERVSGVECGRFLIESALQGIYAGNPEFLSAQLIFGKYFGPRNKVPRAKYRGTVSAPDGMGEVIAALEKKLRQLGVQIELQTELDHCKLAVDEKIVLALSAKSAAQELMKAGDRRAVELAKAELLPIISVTAFFKSTDPRSTGFGCLFPPCENSLALGVLKNNFIFPCRAQNAYSETWILGGAMNDHSLLTLSDCEILSKIMQERAQVFSLPSGQSEIVGYRVTRWPEALPYYSVRLNEILSRIEVYDGKTALVGNYLGEIGLSRILQQAADLPRLMFGDST